jgi:hypothetical protein
MICRANRLRLLVTRACLNASKFGSKRRVTRADLLEFVASGYLHKRQVNSNSHSQVFLTWMSTASKQNCRFPLVLSTISWLQIVPSLSGMKRKATLPLILVWIVEWVATFTSTRIGIVEIRTGYVRFVLNTEAVCELTDACIVAYLVWWRTPLL